MAPRKEKNNMFKKITFKDDTTVIIKAPKSVMTHKSPEDEFIRWATDNFKDVKRIEVAKKPKNVTHIELLGTKGIWFDIFAPMNGDRPLAQAHQPFANWLRKYAPNVEVYSVIEFPHQKEENLWYPSKN